MRIAPCAVRAVAVVCAAAFCVSCTSPEGPVDLPDARTGSTVTDPVTVRSGTFQIKLTLDAVAMSSAGVPIQTPEQFASELTVEDGEDVTVGDSLGRTYLRPAVREALEAVATNSRVDRARLEQLEAAEGVIRSPATGVFSAEQTAVISPGLDMVAALTPIQWLRLQNLPLSGTAVIETATGTRPINCDSVQTVVTQHPESGAEAEANYASLSCRMPSWVETAPGLLGTVRLETSPVLGATLVPDLYVYFSESLSGFAVDSVVDGRRQEVAVDLGPTDGVSRVIVSQLAPGTSLASPPTP